MNIENLFSGNFIAGQCNHHKRIRHWRQRRYELCNQNLTSKTADSAARPVTGFVPTALVFTAIREHATADNKEKWPSLRHLTDIHKQLSLF